MFFYEVIKACSDPIEEAISAQLANPDFNDYPGPESIICQAIDEKYYRLPNKIKSILNLKKQGYTNKEIGIKFECTEQNIRYFLKKYCDFPSLKAFIGRG